jgi:hypothetical protein
MALLATACLVAMYLAGALAIRSSLMPDAAYGLLVHKSMTAGAPWNHMTEPDAADIARDKTYFYAVWSPGQYALPGLLIDAGVSIGAAIASVSIAASVAGLFGWWWLFAVLGYDRASAAVACLLIAASRPFNYSFVSYVGSDVLAFAAFPLLAAVITRCKDTKWLPLLAAVGMGAAFFAKNSLPIYLAAWIAALSIAGLRERGPQAIRTAAAPALAAAATMVLLHYGYNSRGWQPLDYQPAVAASLSAFALPWAMPVLAATSWDDVFARIFSHPSFPLIDFDYKHSVAVVGAIAAASIAGAMSAVRIGRHPSTVVVAAFSVIVLCAFTFLLSTGSVASLDLSRHYRIIGYAWLPLLAQLALASRRRAVSVLLVLALAAPALYGVASFAQNWRRHYLQRASHSTSLRVMHPVATERVVRALELLDRELPPQSSLVVAPSPVHALEFRRTRVLATSANSDVEAITGALKLHGRVDNLVVVAEVPAISGRKLELWLASLQSYDRWDAIDLDNHRFLVPADQPLGVEWLQSRFATLAP